MFSTKKFYILLEFIIIILIFLLLGYKCDYHNQHNIRKRFLIFPQSAPTRHQFIAGIGIPADLETESLTIGYVFKAQYYLPYNASMLRLSAIIPDFYRQKRNAYAKENLSKLNRWKIYDAIEQILDKHGYDGPECLLRTICEYAALPFTRHFSLIEELIHILLLPSTSSAELKEKNKSLYIEAEYQGRYDGSSCARIYNHCKRSLLNGFSLIF